MYQSIPLKAQVKKIFFLVFFDSCLSRYCRIKCFFPKKIKSNFPQTQLQRSCDLSLESFWRVYSKYIYFYGPKKLLIKTLIILSILVKKHLHSLSHEYYQKLFFRFICFYIHQPITLQVYVKKNFFLQFFALFLVQILLFQTFLSKRDLYLTFPAGNFAHHATCGWKVVEEQIPNIYAFMGEKPSIFHIQSLIIFVLFPKKYVNSLLHEYYQKLFLGFRFFYTS